MNGLNKINNGKKERKASKWQLYLKDCLPDQPKESGLGEKVSTCSVTYKQLKEKDPKKLDEIIAKVQSTIIEKKK